MSNIENVIETLEGLFEGQTYTEEERSRIAGYVKNTLEVPGTIWSLEDFEAEADENLTAEERDKVCREAYNAKSNDLSEDDWDNIRATLEEPTNRVMSARPVELGELYYLDPFERVVTKASGWSAPKQGFIREEVLTVKDHPTGDELYKLVDGGEFADNTYFRVLLGAVGFEVHKLIYR